MQFIVFLPYISLFISLFIFRDLLKSFIITYLITFIISIYIGVYIEKIFTAHLESFFTGFRIFLLVFSILILFKIVEKKNKKFFESFGEKNFSTFITIGIFLTILIEGLVGFGTPGMISVRTLFDLNFNPVLSASISLISDYFSTFGAFSTPIIIGAKDAESFEFVKIVGIVFSTLFIVTVFFSTILYSKYEKLNNAKLTVEIIFATIVFVILMFVISQTQFFMFSIIFASLGALLAIFIKDLARLKNFFGVFYPFLLSIIIFIFLKLLKIKWIEIVLSFFNISPVILLIAFFLVLKNNLLKDRNFYIGLLYIFKKAIKLFLIIFFLSFLSSYFLFSSYNDKNIKGVVEVLKDSFSKMGMLYFFISPLIGIFGAFIFGSATMSNLTFVKVQQEIAITSNLDISKILALQSIGAGIGNMISFYNVSTIVTMIDELKGKEVEILKINLIIAIIFSLISSLLVLMI